MTNKEDINPRRKVQVECTVSCEVSAVFELGEDETLDEFRKWFKDKVRANIDLSDSDETQADNAEISDIHISIIK